MQLIAFCKEVTALVDETSEVDTVYQAVKKGFSTVSHNHRWTDEVQARPSDSGVQTSWMAKLTTWSVAWSSAAGQSAASSGVPRTEPVLFDIFINDLHDRTGCSHSNFADDTQLEGLVNTLDMLEKWAEENLM